MAKIKDKLVDRFGALIALIGIVLILIGIWQKGWTIARYEITGIFLYVWAQLIFVSNKIGDKK